MDMLQRVLEILTTAEAVIVRLKTRTAEAIARRQTRREQREQQRRQ